jgi:hypothetical protein
MCLSLRYSAATFATFRKSGVKTSLIILKAVFLLQLFLKAVSGVKNDLFFYI